MACQELGDTFVARHVAFSTQRAPVDHEGWQTVRPAMMGERIQEGICRSVVRLGGVPEDAGDGGKHHEAVERHVAGSLMQQPGAMGFRSKHVVHTLAVENGNRRVIDGHGKVENPFEWMTGCGDFC